LQLLRLHEAVELGLGEAEPQVLVTPEGGHVVIHLFPAWISGVDIGVQGHGFFERQVQHVFDAHDLFG
jgi:hypothetical protein